MDLLLNETHKPHKNINFRNLVCKNRNPTEKNPGNLMPPTYQSQSLDGMLPVTSSVESSSVNTVSIVDKAQLLDSANVSPSTVE